MGKAITEDSFSQTRNVNANTSIIKMLRFSLFCIVLSTLNPYCFAAQVDARTARQYGQQQVNGQQQQQFAPQERQGFGGNAGLNFGPLGNVEVGGNINVPSPGNGLLQNAVMALGALTLVNIVATVAAPYLSGDKGGNSTANARSMRSLVSDETMKALEEAAIDGILKVKAKYL